MEKEVSTIAEFTEFLYFVEHVDYVVEDCLKQYTEEVILCQ